MKKIKIIVCRCGGNACSGTWIWNGGRCDNPDECEYKKIVEIKNKRGEIK